MARNLHINKVKRSVESGFTFSKIYFSKPTSVALITTYITILVLVLATLGFAKLLNPNDPDSSVPSLPDSEPFAFLPADNIEVPTLGEVQEDTPPEEEAPKSEAVETPTEVTPTDYSAPAPVSVPVIVEKEVVKEVPKEVVKTVEKEVVKTVEKEVVKEAPVKIEQETAPEPEQIHYENYDAPEIELPTPPEDIADQYQNFPDDDSGESHDCSGEMLCDEAGATERDVLLGTSRE